jgi:transaldolase
MLNRTEQLKVKIFADGAQKSGMLEMYQNPLIAGFTTNPTLMKKAGVINYKEFALDVLADITDKPVSFEVFSDDFDDMEKQALEISSWGYNVNVKIPITNTKGESSIELVNKLSTAGVRLNVTAMMTIDQVMDVLPAMVDGPGGYISVFAGRIADAGVDPLPIMQESVMLLESYKDIELIWASPRELYNIIQADSIGCHVITVTNDVLKKLPMFGKNLKQFSLETVQMFYNDALSVGYTIECAEEPVLNKFR